MGVYDTVRFHHDGEERFAQLKCWNGGDDFATYEIGSIVPEIEKGVRTYFVALREGGFLFVENDRIMRWVPESEMQRPPIFDKWGGRFDLEQETTQSGLIADEPYKF